MAHPALAWPGLHPGRGLLLPLRERCMDTPFAEPLQLDGMRLQRKREFHVTVLDRAQARVAAAAYGSARLRLLFEALSWIPVRTGRYTLLREDKPTDDGPLACGSLIEHLTLPAMLALRAELTHTLGHAFADPVPHVTHFVHGDPTGIGVPNQRTLAARRVRDIQPWPSPASNAAPPTLGFPTRARSSLMQEPIEPGYMVFVADGELGVGAVREVRPDSRELVVNIENGGDFTLPASAIREVHAGKVILDLDHLPEPVRHALEHPHAAEDPSYAALDPKDGALDDGAHA